MKKIAICLCLLAVLCLTACDPGDYTFDREEYIGKVISVELIEYDNPDIGFLDKQEGAVPFDFAKMTVLEILPEEKISSFVEDFLELGYMRPWNDSDSPIGICIKVNKDDGDFLILGSAGEDSWIDGYGHRCVCVYGEDGQVKEFIGSFQRGDDLLELINQYFETQVNE